MKWSTARAEVSARPSKGQGSVTPEASKSREPRDNREMDPSVTDVDLSMSLIDHYVIDRPLPKN